MLHESQEVVVPEHVAHEESQVLLSIGSLIVTGVSMSFDATGLSSGEKISILKLPVSPEVAGFNNKPISTPYCPEFAVFRKSPSTFIVVFPSESVPIVHVMATVVVNRFAQVSKAVVPPAFSPDTDNSGGSVITTYED